MTDTETAPNAPTTKTCTTCRQEYDPTDPKTAKHHEEPVDGCGCSRCRGKPSCYFCTSSFCFCSSH